MACMSLLYASFDNMLMPPPKQRSHQGRGGGEKTGKGERGTQTDTKYKIEMCIYSSQSDTKE